MRLDPRRVKPELLQLPVAQELYKGQKKHENTPFLSKTNAENTLHLWAIRHHSKKSWLMRVFCLGAS